MQWITKSIPLEILSMPEKHGSFQITQKVFIRDGEKLLILRDRKSGFGDIPGGRMNEDEFFQDWLLSLKREVEEELGTDFKIAIDPKPFLVHKHRVLMGNHPCIIIGYKAKYISGTIQMSDEHDFMDWVDAKTYKMSDLFSEYMLEAMEIYQKEYA